MLDERIHPEVHPPLALRLLGSFEARIAGRSLPALRSRKGEWLLALLALRGERPVSREWLATTLWPDSNPDKALYNLRRTIYDLRQALGSEAYRLGDGSTNVQSESRTLALQITGATIDLTEFDTALKAGTFNGDTLALERTVALYTGPFLDGCEEPWVQEERAVREQGFLNALELLSQNALRQGDPALAVRYLRRALARDTTRETAFRALMQALASAGDYASLRREYRDFRVRLSGERNAPSEESRLLYERLIRQSQGQEVATLENQHSAIGFTPAGGALALDSALYVERPFDALFCQALRRGDSVVLAKGPRQVGKSSMLARALNQARQDGRRVVVTDLQKLADRHRHLESTETFLLALARQLTDRLNLDFQPEAHWNREAGPTENFERFLRRQVLDSSDVSLIWALDEVDQLFPFPWSVEVFGLFRSWHNERALDPRGPWSKLTLAMACATEAHLFITDLNQSPFNVGTRLFLEDFSPENVQDLDGRLGAPLGNTQRLSRFIALVGGHPYLVQQGLQAVLGGLNLDHLEERALDDDGPFGTHLRRLLYVLRQDASLCEAMQQLLSQKRAPNLDSFYRLRSAGVIVGNSPQSATSRCGIYKRYLLLHLTTQES